jgi:hypothetical protein
MSSCTSYTATYSIPLTTVNPPKNEVIQQVNIEKFTDGNLNKYRFEDKKIKAIMYITAKRICFDLTNKTENTAKIMWDEAAIVDYTGSTQRVTHIGVRFMDRDSPKPPTSIPAGTQLHEEVTPISNIYLDRLQWKEAGLFPMFYKSKDEKEAKQYEGKTMKLLLPIDFAGVKNEYLLEFVIDKFTGFQAVNYLP